MGTGNSRPAKSITEVVDLLDAKFCREFWYYKAITLSKTESSDKVESKNKVEKNFFCLLNGVAKPLGGAFKIIKVDQLINY